ncbi:MAG: hypothetical protein LBM69_04135 [Lachnospiraceae bacterium]|jgi:hypothetical protein|nr:hypothetical protein [Lachnospiraceae bacterium]
MHKYKYDYTICTEPDEKLFYKQCKLLEDNVPGIIKGDLLHDVDDSLIQLYTKDRGKIVVHNCYYIGALYVESDIELTQFFKKNDARQE